MSYSLDTLEFAKLLDLIAAHAGTPMGRGRVLASLPFENRHELDHSLAAITETIALNEEKQVTWSFSGLDDPSNAVAILKIKNAALEPNTMLEISRVCTQSLFARSSIQPEKDFAPVLWQTVEMRERGRVPSAYRREPR